MTIKKKLTPHGRVWNGHEHKAIFQQGVSRVPITAQAFTTQEIANLVGVTKRCLLNWLREGKIPEPDRDRNQHRIWTQQDLSVALAYKQLRSQPKRWGQHAQDSDSEP